MKRKIVVVGAGALGGAYAGMFHEMDRGCVSFLAGKERAGRLREEGLTINGRKYSIPVRLPEGDQPPAELVIVAVKHHHLAEALRDMRGTVGPQTLIISVMNGIDSEKKIAAAYGADRVLYAVAVGIDGVRSGNRVQYGNQGKIMFGEAKNDVLSDRVMRVRDLFIKAGINHEIPADMIRVLWWKFMINVGINQASAVLRAPYGEFQRSGGARELMESAMREAIMIADREGVALSESDIDAWEVVLAGLNPEGKTSMLQDVEAGRKTEVEMFAGRVIELGRRHEVPTPVNKKLFEMIGEIEAGETIGDSR